MREQRENGYTLIDHYLQDLAELELDPLALAVHLREQLKTNRVVPNGPSFKAICVIRQLIENQGADPDVLLKQLEEIGERPPDEKRLTEFLEALLKKS